MLCVCGFILLRFVDGLRYVWYFVLIVVPCHSAADKVESFSCGLYVSTRDGHVERGNSRGFFYRWGPFCTCLVGLPRNERGEGSCLDRVRCMSGHARA